MVVDLVSVWLIRTTLPAAVTGPLVELLDEPERQRAADLAPERRDRFVAAHAATRMILSEHLGAPPGQLRWQRGPHGKPELAGDWTGVRVNLSHSGELAALALTDQRPVGVDLQELRDVDACGLAARFFPPAEARFVAAGRDHATQIARFTRLWTRKEACVKGAGGRLAQGLALPVRGHAPVTDPSGALPDGYVVRDVPVPAGFRAAVALAGTGPFRVTRRWWRWP